MSKLSSWKLGLIDRPSLHLTPAPPKKKKNSIPKCMYSKCTKYNICDMICIYIYIYVLRMHNLYIYTCITWLNIIYVMIYITLSNPITKTHPFAAWRIDPRRTGFSFLCLRFVSIHKGMCLIEAARTYAQVAQASLDGWSCGNPPRTSRRNGGGNGNWLTETEGLVVFLVRNYGLFDSEFI